jgi:hypothetical protein
MLFGLEKNGFCAILNLRLTQLFETGEFEF